MPSLANSSGRTRLPARAAGGESLLISCGAQAPLDDMIRACHTDRSMKFEPGPACGMREWAYVNALDCGDADKLNCLSGSDKDGLGTASGALLFAVPNHDGAN